jgi:hypothetical protein
MEEEMIKQPIRYELTPQSVEEGMRWLVLTVENVGDQELTNLDVRLNSLDTYSVRVQSTGKHLDELLPNVVQEIPVQVLASARARLYISVSGWKAMRLFHWESGEIVLKVSPETAVLANLSVISESYPQAGNPLGCEATVEWFAESDGVSLEMGVSKPDGTFAELIDRQVEELSPGDSAVYAADLRPEMAGQYTVYAYLTEGGRRIDRQVLRFHVKSP